MIKFRKARSPRETLNALDEYLANAGAEPVKWLAREVQSWGEFSYAELEAAISDGRLNELINWQERYAKVVNEHFRPMWLAAIAAAAYKESKGRITISDSDISVRDWLMNHGGRLITQLSEESRKAIMTIILDAQQTHNFDAKAIAREIRPLIGLTTRQVEANAKYRQKIFDQYIKNGASVKVASQRADKAALKYASKQHRYRAETIVNTELAFAYNQGAHVGVLQAINAGYMGRCAMVWTTAGTNRVCPRCLALKGSIVGYTNESGVTLPPIHPRCRCTIEYREVEPPRLTTPQRNGNVTPMAPLMGATAAEVVSPTPPKSEPDEAEIRTKLEEAMHELKIKGELLYPPPEMDFADFAFDAEHTQSGKHPHAVTEQEARKFIAEAYFVIDMSKIDSLNFFGADGATYVRPKQKLLRTSFRREEYNPKFLKLIEVCEDELGSSARRNGMPADTSKNP